MSRPQDWKTTDGKPKYHRPHGSVGQYRHREVACGDCLRNFTKRNNKQVRCPGCQAVIDHYRTREDREMAKIFLRTFYRHEFMPSTAPKEMIKYIKGLLGHD